MKKLGIIADNDVAKKSVWSTSAKVIVTGLVKKTGSDTKITETENKIPSTTVLITKTDCDTKITETRNEIPDVTDLIKNIDFDPKLDSSSRVTLNKIKSSMGNMV